MNLTKITDLELRKELRKRNQLRKQRSRKAHGLPKRKKGMGCRIGDRDFAAMEARDFQNPGSYIRRDGSEKLVGLDWMARVDELRKRSGGQCEYVFTKFCPPTRCIRGATDPQHKVKRSVRRDDRMSNLEHLCREHHDMAHPEFKTQWSKR